MRLIQFFSAGLAALLLAACGGTPTPATVSNMVITPAKGACLGCTVSVYSKAGVLLASGTTNATTGKITLDTAGNTSLLLVKVTGNLTAKYFDEKSGTEQSFPPTASMVTVVPSFSSGGEIGVTPLTSMAAKLAGVDTAALGSGTFVAQTLTAASIQDAGARTLLLLGLPPTFKLFAAPVPATLANPVPTDSYGGLLARLGAMAATGSSALALFDSFVAAVPKSTVSTTGVITAETISGTALTTLTTASTSVATAAAAHTLANPTLAISTVTPVANPTAAQVAPAVSAGGKLAQTITWSTTRTAAYFGWTGTLSASAPGGAVTFTATGACTVSGVTVTFTTAAGGSCVITAAQAGDASYDAAPSVAKTITVYASGSGSGSDGSGGTGSSF